MLILQKFWILGGPFYLTLILVLTIYFFGNAKVKRILPGVVIATAAVLAFFYSASQFLKLEYKSESFFRPVDQKVEESTIGQNSFARELKKYLPEDSRGCIYFVVDLPAYYMRKELYPRKFAVTETVGKGCQYVISQFGPMDLEDSTLVLKHNNNYLYKFRQ